MNSKKTEIINLMHSHDLCVERELARETYELNSTYCINHGNVEMVPTMIENEDRYRDAYREMRLDKINVMDQMKKYVTPAEAELLYRYYAIGQTGGQIAYETGRNPATISRTIKRITTRIKTQVNFRTPVKPRFYRYDRKLRNNTWVPETHVVHKITC